MMTNATRMQEERNLFSQSSTESESYDQNDLNSLFFAMKVSSLSYDVENINLDSLSLRDTVRNDPSDDIYTPLIEGLKKSFRLSSKSSAVEEMYMTMAQAMLKCRITIEQENAAEKRRNAEEDVFRKENFENTDQSKDSIDPCSSTTSTVLNMNEKKDGSSGSLDDDSTILSMCSDVDRENKQDTIDTSAENVAKRRELLETAHAFAAASLDQNVVKNGDEEPTVPPSRSNDVPFDELDKDTKSTSRELPIPHRMNFEDIPHRDGKDFDTRNTASNDSSTIVEDSFEIISPRSGNARFFMSPSLGDADNGMETEKSKRHSPSDKFSFRETSQGGDDAISEVNISNSSSFTNSPARTESPANDDDDASLSELEQKLKQTKMEENTSFTTASLPDDDPTPLKARYNESQFSNTSTPTSDRDAGSLFSSKAQEQTNFESINKNYYTNATTNAQNQTQSDSQQIPKPNFSFQHISKETPLFKVDLSKPPIAKAKKFGNRRKNPKAFSTPSKATPLKKENTFSSSSKYSQNSQVNGASPAISSTNSGGSQTLFGTPSFDSSLINESSSFNSAGTSSYMSTASSLTSTANDSSQKSFFNTPKHQPATPTIAPFSLGSKSGPQQKPFFKSKRYHNATRSNTHSLSSPSSSNDWTDVKHNFSNPAAPNLFGASPMSAQNTNSDNVAPSDEPRFSVGTTNASNSSTTSNRANNRRNFLPTKYGNQGASRKVKPNLAHSFRSTESKSYSTNSASPDISRIVQAEKAELVATHRTKGKMYYTTGNYVAAVLSYSSAIIEARYMVENDEVLAILHGNRSAALLMLGAVIAAAHDCGEALKFFSSLPSNAILESNIALKAKLLCRCGRAYLKAGEIGLSMSCFDQALSVSETALKLEARSEEARKVLNTTLSDATLGKADIARWKDVVQKADAIEVKTKRNVPYHQILVHLNNALAISPSCISLHERKGMLLATMRKWDELAMHCEKFACENVKLDGIFVHDLKHLNPYVGVPPAKHLKPDFFEGGDGTLGVSAVCEAVLRLPPSLLPLYFRSLRLEERYVESARGSTALEVYAMDLKDVASKKFAWLPKEREKLRRTVTSKEQGDDLFRNKDFANAASKYADCLRVDEEGELLTETNADCGGKLHAILHCNRAACFVALQKYCEANKECTNALRIAPNYMKAILRRARCNARLRMFRESLSDYQKWVNLIEESRKAMGNSRQCPFDKAEDIAQSDVEKVKLEIEDVKKSMREKEAAAESKEYATNYYDYRERFYSYKDNFHKRYDSDPRFKTHKKRNEDKGSFNANSWQDRSYRQQSYHRAKSDSDKYPTSYAETMNVNCHYEVLKVSIESSSAEIKKAYHKMALKYHPDKNKDPEAAEVFRRVQNAYETLSDNQSRKKYDIEAGFRKMYRCH